MKRIIKYFVVLGLSALVLPACDDYDGISYRRWVGYGMVEMDGEAVTYSAASENAGKYFTIKMDNGAVMKVVNYNDPFIRVKDQDRVYVNFRMLEEYVTDEDGNNTAPIEVFYISTVFSKPVVTRSYINEDLNEREEWLGDDPVKIEDEMWFGGKYLNVLLSVAYDKTVNVKHFINLVYDDVNIGSDGIVNLYIRHNAYDDVPTLENEHRYVYGKKLVSFDISSILPEGKKSVKIKVHWKHSEGSWLDEPVYKYDEGEFIPYWSASANSKDYDSGDANLGLE